MAINSNCVGFTFNVGSFTVDASKNGIHDPIVCIESPCGELRIGQQLVADYEMNIAKAFGSIPCFDVVLPPRKLKVTAPTKKLRKRGRMYKMSLEIETQIVETICNPETPRFQVDMTPGIKVATSVKKPRKEQPKKLMKPQATIDAIIQQLFSIGRKGALTIEIVGKKAFKVQHKKTRFGTRMFAHVQHSLHKIRRVDCTMDRFAHKVTNMILSTQGKQDFVSTEELTYGDSGMILKKKRIHGRFISTEDTDILIVRGRHEYGIVDATIQMAMREAKKVWHYSLGSQYFNAFSDEFVKHQRVAHEGQCTRDIPISVVAKTHAQLLQMVFPCGKITCYKCMQEIAKTDELGWIKRFDEGNELIEQELMDNEQMPQAQALIRFFRARREAKKLNINASLEITRLVNGRDGEIFRMLGKLNDALLRTSCGDGSSFGLAFSALLEVTRWCKNRSDINQSGSLQNFRNRISGKSHINVALMCDNQLDQNGNFLWGKRGYHAKRFFANYFEKVDPLNGYEKHKTRKNPNGKRELAIGNLIVSTNFEVLRKQLKGNLVTQVPLSESCISRLNGNFLYNCCCATLEDGKPHMSDLKIPTRNHLVIGNTGDAKYVDLPTQEEENLLIAKEGYCYVNIFLAMLVNVSENDAKDFTKKMVRDLIIPKLGKWPKLIDVATACHLLSVFYPDTRNAELPRILVDHSNKTMHVIDSYGSLDTGFHTLKATTVNQLIGFASEELQSEMKNYYVGGTTSPTTAWDLSKLLIRGIYRPHMMQQILLDEPCILALAILSPSVLIALFNSGSLDRAASIWMGKQDSIVRMVAILEMLTKKVSTSRLLVEQRQVLEMHARPVFEEVFSGFKIQASYNLVLDALQVVIAMQEADERLTHFGFLTHDMRTIEIFEKNYQIELQASWNDLSWREKFSTSWSWSRAQYKLKVSYNPIDQGVSKGVCAKSLQQYVGCAKEKSLLIRDGCLFKIKLFLRRARVGCARVLFSIVRASLPDLLKAVNLLMIVAILLGIINQVYEWLLIHQRYKRTKILERNAQLDEMISTVYESMCKDAERPTESEFEDKLSSLGIDVKNRYDFAWKGYALVKFQAKNAKECQLEQIIAFMTLLSMLYSPERSDCLFKALNKVKGVLGTIENDVYHQVDDIQDIMEEKEATVDFVLEGDKQITHTTFDVTFNDWWQNQLNTNHVVAHYRVGGAFLEFTRSTCVAVCNKVNTMAHSEFLIRGGVGSGKSTGLPFYLSRRGNVLIIEPTRPLAENVCKQLRGEPFLVNPTLRMRGLVSCGSAPIDVMTSGYALHYLANARSLINSYSYIIFDECHVLDSSAMAFYSLLKDHSYTGKVLKVSATPPGRETEFEAMNTVTFNTEDSLSFDSFVRQQGSGSNADVVNKGDSILVYVASYNEVDQLSKLLADKGYLVTKVDGRTMKVGNVEIITQGTATRKHFIVATNIIENGVTLDIDVVVDFGTKVVADLDIDNRMMQYRKVSVTYGERIQRIGRVGRVKNGHALRIGHTEKGLAEIPVGLATEAAFLCFVYGLPVMTHNVTTSLLGRCTRKQARTMMHFELPPYFTVNLVGFNGTMHPKIHDILKAYKLRDSEITLSPLAIPHKLVDTWITASQYVMMGARIALDEGCRIPFYVKDLPDKVYNSIWRAVIEHRSDAGFGRLTTHSAVKIAYTLETDVVAIPRTIAIIDALIEQEQVKQAHFKTLQMQSCTAGAFTLASIANTIRSKYAVDHTSENIEVLQRARAQLLEFSGIEKSPQYADVMRNYGVLNLVKHQSAGSISKELKLQGRWNGKLLTRDIFVNGCLLGGGIWLIWKYFSGKFNEDVIHQGMGKRQRQKLRFRDTAVGKLGREVYADDNTIEHFFGEAYTKKGKSKGRHATRGMGTKTRHFMNIYGFDPSEYAIVRYVDPLTGATQDENPLLAIDLVQERFADIRRKMIEEDELDPQTVLSQPGIQAYYLKARTGAALKIDLTPHNPLLVCKSNNIAGFPEHEFVLRQTGKAITVKAEEVPQENSSFEEDVSHEAKTLNRGLRDYNPISSVICRLTNETDGHNFTLFGVGFGGCIITNRHLFKLNNGSLRVQSQHGEFFIKNATQLKMLPVGKTDLLIIQMPKDFPVMPKRLRFRTPKTTDKVCLIATNFQEKFVSSLVSEDSSIYPVGGGDFWQHWITTKDGHCGLPLVSTRDGVLLGLHSLATVSNSKNFFAAFPENFETEYLEKLELKEWTTKWKYNANEVCWGGLKLQQDKADGIFNTTKGIAQLFEDLVYEQNASDRWMFQELKGNLKAVAYTPNQLVTKHVVKGPCLTFVKYLSENVEAFQYFQPLMGFYQKSKLNKAAFVKDIMKYSQPITLGEVNVECFEAGFNNVKRLFEKISFEKCEYITDPDIIYNSLNLKAAVGALYTGKKKDYFAGMELSQVDALIRASCFRLYQGKFGIWNGSLKAELRPLEKVLANKTRTFTAAPLDTLLGAKVCVDDFNAQFYSKHLEGFWTVGICKFYKGWDRFMTELPDGWLYCDADGSQFDSSLTPYLLNAVLRLRLEYMEDWSIGEEMLRNLYTEIIYTPIATPDGTIVKKFRGNNSGQPSTVVDNTLMVILTMQYALAKQDIGFQEQEDIIRYFANGDDLLIAVNGDKGIALLNTLQESFSEMGLNYDFNDRTHNKSELSFMSHQALEYDGMYIPKIKKERIVSILEWDRSVEPEHRMEAICAAMVEAWGYPELLHEIRKFYAYMLDQEPFSELNAQGRAHYISEQALKTLYMDGKVTLLDIEPYLQEIAHLSLVDLDEMVYHQADKTIDAGTSTSQSDRAPQVDRDINAGTFVIPRIKALGGKMALPKVRGKNVINLQHLLNYSPEQTDISNTRATHKQFATWYDRVMESYGVTDAQMEIILNGLMVWCIENGTSPNLSGMWTMMDKDEQVEYPLKPILENAQPTFRQIMAHFSNAAEAYIEKRNSERRYMPRFGSQRNLTDYSLARYAFDFYEITSHTPVRAREAHIQMKAAALRNTKTRMFGLDGKVGTEEEDTERHVTTDVNRNMHSLLGVNM
nr:polyprotein [Vallota mosaic virus]